MGWGFLFGSPKFTQLFLTLFIDGQLIRSCKTSKSTQSNSTLQTITYRIKWLGGSKVILRKYLTF